MADHENEPSGSAPEPPGNAPAEAGTEEVTGYDATGAALAGEPVQPDPAPDAVPPAAELGDDPDQVDPDG